MFGLLAFPDLAVGAYIGHDEPKTLGEKETRGQHGCPDLPRFYDGSA
jgi:membrane carboxypeptidase/penicillin-binding protein